MKTWISVESQLPPEEDNGVSALVLVFCYDRSMGVNRYDYGWEQWYEFSHYPITHWQPLPDPPQTT